MYADTWEAQTDGVDQQKCCIFQDPVDLSGQETKRSFSGSDCCFTSTLQSLSICLLSVSTSSSVTHLWTVIQTFIQKYWQKVKTQFLFSFFSYSAKSHCVVKVTIFHLCEGSDWAVWLLPFASCSVAHKCIFSHSIKCELKLSISLINGSARFTCTLFYERDCINKINQYLQVKMPQVKKGSE